MAHIGNELRFVPTRKLELARLLLDLAEKARIAQRNRRLICERLQQRHCLGRKRANMHSSHGQRPEHLALQDHWHCKQRAHARVNMRLIERMWDSLS